MEESKTGRKNEQNIYIENQGRITVTGVSDVGAFDEEEIRLSVAGSDLVVRGRELHIQRLDLEEGKVVISGKVRETSYVEKKEKGEGGFLRKVLK